jgi:hypothetical protein
MEPYIDEFGNLQFKQPANYTGINGINMNQLNIEPYNSMAEMREQPESRSVLDQGLPFALPNLNYRNYDLSNLFNRNTQPDFINAPQDYYQPMVMRKDLGMDTSYGVASEPDEEQVEYLPGQEPKSFRDSRNLQEYFQNRNPLTGIMNLFRNLPTPMNILRGGLQGIQSLNQKLRGTTFGMSPTLKDYFQAKKAEKKAAAGADVGVGGEGRGSRRGDADISSSQRGSFATDDTAGFF